MDPDACLAAIRETTADMHYSLDHGTIDEASATQLVEHFEALDGWLSKGGFPPEPWRNPRY